MFNKTCLTILLVFLSIHLLHAQQNPVEKAVPDPSKVRDWHMKTGMDSVRQRLFISQTDFRPGKTGDTISMIQYDSLGRKINSTNFEYNKRYYFSCRIKL